MYGSVARQEDVLFGLRNCGITGKKCQSQVRTEEIHPGLGMVRIQAATGIQADMAWRDTDCSTAAKHEQEMSGLRVCFRERSQDTSEIPV
jgi:hypothetical protein